MAEGSGGFTLVDSAYSGDVNGHSDDVNTSSDLATLAPAIMPESYSHRQLATIGDDRI